MWAVINGVLITAGMVYYLLSNRTQFRRTNNVLNLLAIYSINCGTLDLYRDTLIYIPSIFIMFWLNFCAFMAILNSRRYLRFTLNEQGGVVATFTQLKVRTGTTFPWGAQEATEASTNAAVLKSLPPAFVSSDTSLSDSVMAFDRERYLVPPVTVMHLGLGLD
ncbi:hypothetical protein EDB86DRAFT_3166370 [Lactarius hatsudake]|nr:hypothetical protein EDB86DRAFT_3166370 [Lactarius hatsudake]